MNFFKTRLRVLAQNTNTTDTLILVYFPVYVNTAFGR